VSGWRRWRLPRIVWSAGGIVVTYLAVEQLFAYETSTRGLLSPSGAPHLGVLALGAAFVALRFAVYFVVPALGVFAVIHRVRGP
jgi:hypothetical protein